MGKVILGNFRPVLGSFHQKAHVLEALFGSFERFLGGKKIRRDTFAAARGRGQGPGNTDGDAKARRQARQDRRVWDLKS